ncbi:MAG: HPr family phosphocarrier protein [Spirochaetaceae bacterium]|nr:HPr family phosphocarrier protein [Spirochaetaceae bacterium]
MVEREVMIANRAGVHARPAALLVRTANRFQADIYLEKDGERVNGKSIMGIIALGAAYRTTLRVIATGADEAEAVEALVRLVASKFQATDDLP